VIVEDGFKQAYIHDLAWLERVAAVTYHFQNTMDGFKLLFADDVFCEFAVFEMHELASIPFAPGRIVWKKPGVPDELAVPALEPPPPSGHDLGWHIGEALTHLYVGLQRFNRGEKLFGARFVQQYALDCVLWLAERLDPGQPAFRDAFSSERHFEQRFPKVAQHLASFVQGYERTPESALAILVFLEAHAEVNAGMAAAIRKLVGTSNLCA
jgi:hypothetical protein